MNELPKLAARWRPDPVAKSRTFAGTAFRSSGWSWPRTGVAALLGLPLLLLASRQAEARELSFVERVRAQEAIERVYYSHQIGTTRPFEEAFPRAQLERTVRTYLGESAALSTIWRTPVTAAMLAAEHRRMTLGSRMPDRLRELERALGNDSFLIEECLARPVLVDRLARSFFIHDQTRGRESGSGTAETQARVGAFPSVDRRIASPQPDQPSVGAVAGGPNGGIATRGMTWDEWREQVGSKLNISSVRAVAHPAANDALPSETHAPSAAARPLGAPACIPDDTWHNGSLDITPDGRYVHTAVWTGSLMVVWGGYPALQTGARYDPATDAWSATSLIGAPDGRAFHTAVWTGQRMIVWGGFDGGTALATGGLYDPASDTWQATSPLGAPSSRARQSAVWTGSRMLVWGGFAGDSFYRTGASYDPEANTWSPLSTVGAPLPRGGQTAVWTGSRMLIWGGFDAAGHFGDGASYDPVANGWVPISDERAPLPRAGHTAVWTGSVMVIWGGNNQTAYFDSGGRYDPVQDSWTTTAGLSAPAARSSHTAIWDGGQMLLWGGFDGFGYFGNGKRYDPVADRWTPIGTLGEPNGRAEHSAVWTGNLMIVWGGVDAEGSLDTGGRFDPFADSWTPTLSSGAPFARSHHTAVWTGSFLVVWGGFSAGGEQGTGGRYDPATDSWRPTSLQNAPVGRNLHTAVWTGRVMIVWGGYRTLERPTSSPALGTGGRYDPGTDTWLPTSMTKSPVARYNHSAIWSGKEMIIWGGVANGIDARSGARYDPRTDTWSATALENAPSGRASHSAVWTGAEMVIFGGYVYDGAFHSLDSGGRYDPLADTWTPVSMIGAPSTRQEHLAFWTGSRMLIWGGYNAGDPNEDRDTGALYDPETDTWSDMSDDGAPPFGLIGAGAWTGHELLVWSGPAAAGRYDAEADTWTPLSVEGAPTARRTHTAVWTGSDLIVWGGYGGGHLSTGGRYALGSASDDDADGLSECGGDCSDSDGSIHPGAAEVCDGRDNDCDGQIDDGLSCGLRITNPLAADLLECVPGAPPPQFTWAPDRYDVYRVFVSRGAGFGAKETITSGDTLLKRSFWSPKAKAWRKFCAKPGSDLFIKVQGVDRDAPRSDPDRKAFSPAVQAETQSAP